MKKEETDLLKRCGTENPFTVPEGYFANFTEQLMDKLPEREIQPAPQLTLWARVKPWVYMAAMFCGLMLSVRMFVGEKETQSPAAGTMGDMVFSEVPDEYIDPIVDQTMISFRACPLPLVRSSSEHRRRPRRTSRRLFPKS